MMQRFNVSMLFFTWMVIISDVSGQGFTVSLNGKWKSISEANSAISAETLSVTHNGFQALEDNGTVHLFKFKKVLEREKKVEFEWDGMPAQFQLIEKNHLRLSVKQKDGKPVERTYLKVLKRASSPALFSKGLAGKIQGKWLVVESNQDDALNYEINFDGNCITIIDADGDPEATDEIFLFKETLHHKKKFNLAFFGQGEEMPMNVRIRSDAKLELTVPEDDEIKELHVLVLEKQ